MKHTLVKVFGKDLFEFQSSNGSTNGHVTREEFDTRFTNLEGGIAQISGLFSIMEKEISGLATVVRVTPTESVVDVEEAQIVDPGYTSTPVPDWKKASLSVTRRYMSNIYDDLARQFQRGHNDLVLAAGSDYDPDKPQQNIINAIKAGLDKRGFKAVIVKPDSDEMVVSVL